MTLAERIHQHLLKIGVPVLVGDMPNIVYVQDADEECRPIKAQLDRWDDRRILLKVHEDGTPEILLNVPATTTAGWRATLKKKAEGLGVARIVPGYHHQVWKFGKHRGIADHPCLRQRAPLKVCRDWNWNMKADDNVITYETVGLNQHGAKKQQIPTRVGYESAGCLVGQVWADHIKFMNLITRNKVYALNRNFAFSATIIGGVELYASTTLSPTA